MEGWEHSVPVCVGMPRYMKHSIGQVMNLRHHAYHIFYHCVGVYIGKFFKVLFP
jgi:hypothetical protein